SCGGTPCSTKPTAVGGLARVMAVAAGKHHSLALLPSGTLRARGWNRYGQLGNGNNTGPDSCGGDPCSQKPLAVGGLTGVVSIAGGQYHSIAVRSNGTAQAWGRNAFGQLGNGTTTDSSKPVPITGLSSIAGVGSGSGHSLALLRDGTARAWGSNFNGQLGNGNNTGPEDCSGTPCSKTPIGVNSLSSVTAIAVPGNASYNVALIGPSRRLSVLLAGAGKGVVGAAGILCPLTCAHRYPQASPVSLVARAAVGSAFAGFSVGCEGTGPCRV